MCGISGVWQRDGRPVPAGVLARMSDCMAHRGPDGAEQLLVDSRGQHPAVQRAGASEAGSAVHDLALVHRRLAIIDLISGDQPMVNEDGSLWIVFNGEIYNYRELRAELRGRGHRFRTQSDTEVILHAYEDYGLDSPRYLNGIFAFGIWDAARQHLFLARDHFGVKPLYYTSESGAFRFASELKAILADPAVRRDVDLDALNLCLTFRHTPAPWTLFKGIAKLPPASYAVVRRTELKVERYWESAEPPLAGATEDELEEALADGLERAVRRQMVSDVPLSLSLSSGVDSSALLAIMARHSSDPVRTFTVGFSGREDVSEIGPAADVARRFGALPTSQVITQADYADFLRRYMWHLEEPTGNDSAPAYFFVARLAQQHGIKVMLNGQGPDEAYAGYSRHLGAAVGGWLAPIDAVTGPAFSTLAKRLRLDEGPERLARALAQRSELDQFVSIYTFVSPDLRHRLLNGSASPGSQSDLPREYVAAHLARAPTGTRLERMLWIDARTSLADNLLLCEDKMAMAAGVEARVPFLDLELMALAERVPGKFKLRRGRGKWIHRRVCARFLPADVIARPKIGFDNAVDLWLATDMGQELSRLASSPHSFTRTHLSHRVVDDLLVAHRHGVRDHRRVLFLLLSLEIWYRTFIDTSS